MTLVTAGSLVWPIPLTANQRDWRVLQELSRDWSRHHLFAKTNSAARARWEQDGITCEYIPARRPAFLGRASFVLSVASSTLRLHRAHGVTLFVASDPLSALAGWIVRQRTGVPVLLHLQGELIAPPAAYGSRSRRASLSALTRWVCRRVDAVRVVYPGQVAELAALGLPADRIFVVGSRCDTNQYERSRWLERGMSLRHEQAGQSSFVAVYVGTLLEGKGLQVAIEAWTHVLRRVPDARLLLVGDGPFRRSLEERVDERGLGHAVRFVGAVQYDDVPGYLASADAFVLPSFSEGSPRAVIEAMSMSLPVVASRVGGIPDLVEDGATGLLVAPGDARALAAHLVDLADDAGRRAQLGSAARRVIVERFDFATVMAQMRTLYRRIAAPEGTALAGEAAGR